MPVSIGTLGYVSTGMDLAPTTLTDIYTVPALFGSYAPMVKIKGIVVTNRGAAGTFRLSYAPLGAADAIGQYIAYDTPIGAGEIVPFEFFDDEFTLVATDVIRGYSSTGDMTFHVFGKAETD